MPAMSARYSKSAVRATPARNAAQTSASVALDRHVASIPGSDGIASPVSAVVHAVKRVRLPDPPNIAVTASDDAPLAFGPAHVDTLALHFWKKPPGMRAEILAINGGRVRRWEGCRDANGERRGYLLYVHQPKIETLHALDEWLLEFGGCISRFDIAFELSPSDPEMPVEELVSWMSRNTLLKWRPAGPSLEMDNGNFYFVLQEARVDGRKSKRDVLIYKRWSKIRQEFGCDICQFELRFQRSEAAKREKVLLPTALIPLNPRDLFKKHVKVVDMDGYVASSIRASIQDERRHFQQQHQMEGYSTSASDGYRASLAQRIASIWQRGCQRRAQTFKDNHPVAAKKLKILRGRVLLSDQLVWRDEPRSTEACIDNPRDFLKSPPYYRIDMEGEQHQSQRSQRENQQT